MAKRNTYTTDIQIRNHTEPGRYPCGDSFYLDTKPSGAKAFVLRVSVGGKIVERGLGSYPQVKLGEARAKAREWALRLRQGETVGERAGKQKIVPVVSVTTFRQAADEVFKLRELGWKPSSIHRAQWGQSLERYVFPMIGDKPVSEVTQDDIENIFAPIWAERRATAGKLLSRVGMVLDWAIAKKLRTDNPAKANGPLQHLLPAVKRERVSHAALPYAEIAAFMVDLRSQYFVAARALEFTILTATRTTEVLQAKWDEIDFDEAMWTIPASRMKRSKQHRVPLSSQAIALLKSVQPLKSPGGWIFPGKASHLSSMAMMMLMRRMHPGLTVHGFRSTFRDWASAVAKASYGAAETALAHKVALNKTEEAYHREEYLTERRGLMQRWADYCDGIEQTDASDLIAKLKASGLSKEDILAALA